MSKKTVDKKTLSEMRFMEETAKALQEPCSESCEVLHGVDLKNIPPKPFLSGDQRRQKH